MDAFRSLWDVNTRSEIGAPVHEPQLVSYVPCLRHGVGRCRPLPCPSRTALRGSSKRVAHQFLCSTLEALGTHTAQLVLSIGHFSLWHHLQDAMLCRDPNPPCFTWSTGTVVGSGSSVSSNPSGTESPTAQTWSPATMLTSSLSFIL